MIKLKRILQSKYCVLFLIAITLILLLLGFLRPIPKLNDNLMGRVVNVQIKANKVTFQLSHYLINYYVDTLDELEYLKSNYKLGDYIKVEGTTSVPKDNTNFNLFNYRLYLRSKKIYYTVKADKIELVKKNSNILFKIKNYIIERINRNINSNYLNAFILGSTKNIDDDIVDSYQINGISHLFAISGMHVSLLSGVILFLLNKIRKRDINYVVTIIFLFFYSFLASYSPSVLRSCFLFMFIFINKKFKLEIKTSYLFIYITCIFLIYNPYYIYNVGFLFSFTISFFLIIYGSITNNYKNYFIKLLLTSFIAFLAGLPITINNFYSVNLLSPVLNLIFVPLVSFIIFPLSLLTFIFSFLTPILNLSINLLELISVYSSHINLTIILCHIPWYVVILYYLIIIFILEKMKKKRYYYLILIYVILFLHTNTINLYDEIHMLDIGQGDSILIRLKYNKGNILIDTGGITSYAKEDWKKSDYSLAENITIPYMKSLGIKHLDYLITTHGDNDHIGEAINLVNNFKINEVILNKGKYNYLEQNLIDELNKKNIKYSQSKDKIDLNNTELYFLNTKNYDNENDNSNVIYMELNNKKVLFMGDAGITKEKDILNKYNFNNIDILKVGHHGSDTSSSEEFIKTLKPKTCLISVGTNNRYGHPKESTLKILDGCNIYRTDLNGSIKIIFNNYKIKTIK